jgi:hypothetical protein
VRVVLRQGAAPGIARGAVAVMLGAAMLLAANFATAGRLGWTPGGIALSFGRMLQDGIVARYLAEHCPDPRFRLCAHRAELPSDADVFFWSGDGSLFNRLGRFSGLGDEMATIVAESVRDYPALQLKLALIATARQLVRVETGEGDVNTIWHSYGIIERFEPQTVPDMRAARQQNGGFDFTAINRIHVPVALASMLLLLVIPALALRRPRFADAGRLAATVALALLGNAVVCGVLANPHDRYGARLVWLAPLAVLLALARAAATAQAGALTRPATALGADPAGR